MYHFISIGIHGGTAGNGIRIMVRAVVVGLSDRGLELSGACVGGVVIVICHAILKRERYYGRRFTSKQELVQMIEQYIRYYNTKRVQRNLGVLTPMEKHELCLAS